MKLAIQIFAFLMAMPTYAGDIYRSSDPELQNMVKVVEKDGRCDLAVVERARPNAPDVIKNAGKDQIHSFICIGDIVLNSGTLKEKKGCAVFVLDGNDMTTSPLVGRFGYNIAENKKCDTDGFEAVVKDQVFGKIFVNDKLIDTNSFPTEKVLLYATNNKYLNWYKKARTDREAKLTKELAGKKGNYPKFFSGYQDTKGTTYKELVSGEPLIKSGK